MTATPGGRPPHDAVLFDRDGTLVVDVPYNGDPERVRPMAFRQFEPNPSERVIRAACRGDAD